MSRKMDQAFEHSRRLRLGNAKWREAHDASARELRRQAKLAVEAWDCPDPKLAKYLARAYGVTTK